MEYVFQAAEINSAKALKSKCTSPTRGAVVVGSAAGGTEVVGAVTGQGKVGTCGSEG